MKNQKKRTFVSIICAVLLLTALCSSLFIMKEADHDCTGADCPICAAISEAENTLKKLGNAKPVLNRITLPANMIRVPVLVIQVHVVLYAAVQMHNVRMNN